MKPRCIIWRASRDLTFATTILLFIIIILCECQTRLSVQYIALMMIYITEQNLVHLLDTNTAYTPVKTWKSLLKTYAGVGTSSARSLTCQRKETQLGTSVRRTLQDTLLDQFLRLWPVRKGLAQLVLSIESATTVSVLI